MYQKPRPQDGLPILFLLKYLQENTDDTHSVNMNELISAYKDNGYSATRKTIADDIDELINAGFDITVNNEKHNLYTYSYLQLPSATSTTRLSFRSFKC